MSAWDPITAARDRAARRAVATAPPPLNPPWPWRLLAFDPARFGVAQDPPREPTPTLDTSPPNG